MGGFQGDLSSLTAPQLGGIAIKSAIVKAGLNVDDIDETVMGNVLSAGVGQAPARQASLHGGIPNTVPCTTVSKVCGSGMKAVMIASDLIEIGRAGVVVAGGMESMSNAPYLLAKARGGYRLGHGEIKDHMFLDGLEDAYEHRLMGTYAEEAALHYQLSRDEQDAYALESLMRARRATESGHFEREIAPVAVMAKSGESLVIDDEQPRRADPAKIPMLRPAFSKNGTVTAANSSSISDGAAALVLAGESVVKSRGLKPLARIVAQASYAGEPRWFTTAPVGAIRKVLELSQWRSNEVDLFEINEAFANVAMIAMRELRLPHEKVNINGGACALGHPIGASGARILVTLLNALKGSGGSKGVASLCIGGGEATAMAVELL
jgi:acetyl-CoA C-acetyltransferase